MSRQAAQAWLCSKLGINLPYYSMGRVDSYDLFGPNELILFAFYEHNRDRYKRVLDIGANLGLHSILMAKLGWDVHCYEPDATDKYGEGIYDQLEENIKANCGKSGPLPYNAAVSDRDGEAKFIRVLDNLTGSCLAGGVKQPFGPMETITVRTVDCRPLFDWADLAKIDVEGHESVLLLTLTKDQLSHLDLICELRGQKEAAKVLQHVHNIGGEIYTQKNDWKPAQCMSDMPVRHTEGSIFISSRWGPFG